VRNVCVVARPVVRLRRRSGSAPRQPPRQPAFGLSYAPARNSADALREGL